MIKYKIENLKNYPDNGNHQQCVTKLPFEITKGKDSFLYYEHNSDLDYKIYNAESEYGDNIDNRWIAVPNDNANISLRECYTIKPNSDLSKILKWCERYYILSLEMEIRRLKKEYETYQY